MLTRYAAARAIIEGSIEVIGKNSPRYGRLLGDVWGCSRVCADEIFTIELVRNFYGGAS